MRVSSADGTRDELAEVARLVRPGDDHLLAPRVPDPPGGLEAVCWADAEVGVSLVSAPQPSSEWLPAGERGPYRGVGPWRGAGTVVAGTGPWSSRRCPARPWTWMRWRRACTTTTPTTAPMSHP